MLGLLILATAGQASQAAAAAQIQMHQVEVQGPMPAENIYLRPGHKGTNNEMFPDIAVDQLSINGDTLYVHVLNKGATASPGQVLVTARAEANGVKSELVEGRTGRLVAGEARWVPLRGFSVKTAAIAPTVFALESANAIAAVARMMSSSTPALDRSGQTREQGTTDADETNNSLTATGPALKHGRPR